MTANDGFQASRVFYTVDGADTDVAADESGTYTIPAEAVNDGLAITVETAEIPAADEPAADDAAGEADGVATLTVNVENSTVTLTNAEGEEQKVSESQDVEVAADEDLALTVEPAEDYELESVTVTDAEGETEEVEEKDSFTISATELSDGMTISAMSLAPAANNEISTLAMTGSGTQSDPYILAPGESSDRIMATYNRDADRRLQNATTWEGYQQRTEASITDQANRNSNNCYAVVTAAANAQDGDEFSLQYYESGWFGYTDVIKEVYFRVQASSERTVTFNANGGTGGPTTWTVEPSDGTWAVSLPDPSDVGISNGGKVFAGWSTQANGQSDNFVAGIEYQLTGQSTQLYAIWFDPEAESQDNVAYFYIRKDGAIQYEPAAYDGSNYYPTASAETLQGKLHNAVAVNNNLEAVDANLAQVPTEQQIKNVLQSYGVSYDSENQYIEWYVIKFREKIGGTTYWNVDGVIRDKNKNEVAYNPNGGDTNVPGSNEYAEGVTVNVDFSKTPSRAGYTFLGWDESKDAADPTYKRGQEPSSFTMPDHDVTLYAIWSANNQTPYKVEYYYEGDDGSFELKKEVTRRAKTDSQVSVNESDKTPDTGYYFDESNADNVLSGTVSGEGDLVLKLYFAKQHEITVEAKSDTVKYSGDEQSVSGIVTDTFVVEGNTYTVEGLSAEAKGTDAGEYASVVTGTAVVKDADGNVVTDQFKVNTQAGKLTIQKRDVTFTSGTSSREYNGEPLTNDEVTVGGDGFVKGEGADFTVTGTQTLVGSSKNFFDYTLTGGAKAGNYNITKVEGTLTVTNRSEDAKYEITAFAPDGEYLYDGKEHTAEGVTFDNLTFNGVTYTVRGLSSERTEVDAGNYTTEITGTAQVLDPDGNDVTDQFTVDTADLGMLVISKRQVTLTSDSAIKLYDGTPLKAESVTVSGDGFADGEGATYNYGEGQTEVGTSDNTFEWVFNDGTKSGNYVIDPVVGELTVFSSSINPDDDPLPDPDDPDYPQPGDEDKPYYSGVKVDTPESVDYDGKDHKWVPTVLDKDGNPLPAENYTVTYLDEDGNEVDNFVDVKTITVVIEGQNGYTGTVKRSYEIRKIDLTVTTESATKVYDGEPLTAPGKIEGLVKGDATFTVTGTITNEGTETNTYELDWVGNKADNYNITENLGKLTIIAQSIDPDDKPDPDDPDKPTYDGVWVSDAPESVIYDGQPHQWTPTVLDEENGEPLPEGSYSVTYVDDEGNTVTDFTNVTGDIHVVITGEGNYTGKVERVYHIDPRPLDVIIPEQTKTYDGTEDVIREGDITLNLGDTYIANDDVVATIAPENVKFAQADVHEDGDLVASIDNVTLTGADAHNYELRNISGTGSITQAGVTGFTLSASGYSGAYDGQAHDAVTSAVVTEKAESQQRAASWEITYSLTEDGTYTADIPTVTNVADSTTVYVKASNANYGEMVIPVQATVTPLTLTVTANNQTKVAGTADPALTSIYTGALPGETPGWTGTIARVPGEAAGTYQIFQNTLGIEDNGAFLAGNYTLVFVNGTLTITAAPGGGDNPDDGGDDTPTTPTTPTTPGTTTDGGTPTVIEDAPEQPEPEQIDDDENPLAGPSESIDDDGTPLARPTHQDCWVHWLMILGIIVTAIYDVLALIRRRKFTGTLASFEDEVLNDRNRNA